MRQQLGPQLRPGDVRQPRGALRAGRPARQPAAARAAGAHASASASPTAQLQQFIAELPPFQEDGKFSHDKYKQVLATQNMTPRDVRAARAAASCRSRRCRSRSSRGNIVAKTSVQRYLSLLEQQREVAVATIDAEPFLKDTKIDDAQAKAFYDKNAAAFQIPEQAKHRVRDAEPGCAGRAGHGRRRRSAPRVRGEHQAVQRRPRSAPASHILIAVKPDASRRRQGGREAEGRGRCSRRRRPTRRKFAELAKANSQDPGSAQQGGDLGTFARGSMVKPFEDAVFAAKVGDIVGPVQTDFGYHVIKVTRHHAVARCGRSTR